MKCFAIRSRLFFSQQRRSMTCLLVGLLLAPSSQAADLVSVYQAALRNNGQWSAQEYDYLANRLNTTLAAGELLPQVSLQGSLQQQRYDVKKPALPDTSYHSHNVGIGLRQAIFRADKWKQLEVAALSNEADGVLLLQQHQQLTEQLINAYLAILQAQALSDSLEAEYNAIAAQDRMMQARLAEGVVARVDTQETHARLQSVNAARASNEVAILNAKQQLALLTGQPVDNIATLALPISTNLVASKSLDNWLQLAAQQNLDIELAQLQVAIADKRLERTQAGRYPTIDLVANVGQQTTNHPTLSNPDTSHYQIGLELNVPLYTGGKLSTAAQQNRLQRQAAEQRLGFIYQNTMTQTSRAYLNLMAQKTTIQAQQAAVDANRQVAQASKVGYDLGVRSMVDTLLAERQYRAAERDLINAYFDYLNAYLQLQKACGQLDASTVQTLNQLLAASP